MGDRVKNPDLRCRNCRGKFGPIVEDDRCSLCGTVFKYCELILSDRFPADGGLEAEAGIRNLYYQVLERSNSYQRGVALQSGKYRDFPAEDSTGGGRKRKSPIADREQTEKEESPRNEKCESEKKDSKKDRKEEKEKRHKEKKKAKKRSKSQSSERPSDKKKKRESPEKAVEKLEIPIKEEIESEEEEQEPRKEKKKREETPEEDEDTDKKKGNRSSGSKDTPALRLVPRTPSRSPPRREDRPPGRWDKPQEPQRREQNRAPRERGAHQVTKRTETRREYKYTNKGEKKRRQQARRRDTLLRWGGSGGNR